MTVVVALVQDNNMYIAADRMVSGEDIKMTSSKPKIWRRPGYLFGFCGTLEGEHLREKFRPPKPFGDIDKFMHNEFMKSIDEFYTTWDIYRDKRSDDGLGLLVVVNGQIYEHSPAYLTATRYESNFLAIGSGAQYALGAMHATEGQKAVRRLKTSIEAACKYSTTCGLPMDILNTRIT